MKKTKTSNIGPLAGTAALAAAGQALLIQTQWPWTAGAGALAFLAAGWLLTRALPSSLKEQASVPFTRWEKIFLPLLFLLALFFRLYRLDEFPPGLFNDVAKQGYGALRILHEGWSPFQESSLYLGGNLCTYFYWLALWFRFVEPSTLQLFLASVTLSLMAFPLFYLALRRLAGPKTALLALFFLSVMRWHVTYSRSGHPAVEVPFYLFGALAAWLHYSEKGSRWSLGVLALFLTGGCYAYESFLAFLPALALYGLYEALQRRASWKANRTDLLKGSAMFLMMTFPIWHLHIMRGTFGASFDQLAVVPPPTPSGLIQLLHRALEALLMFNRQGDHWFVHNIPDHRMLDDITGALMLLAVLYGLAHWRERRYFYGLVGLGCSLLPNLFTILPTHASRAFGATGFCAFLAACVLGEILDKLPRAWGLWKPAVLAGLLALCAVQDFSDYFRNQAHQLEPWRGHGWEATRVGEKIQALGNKEEYYLSPSFYGHYALLFLGYPQRTHMREFVPEALPLSGGPENRGALVALAEGQTGWLELLRKFYPGGEEKTLRDPDGRPLAYFYQISPEKLRAGSAAVGKFLQSPSGLNGSYYTAASFVGQPTLVHRDLLLNFTFHNDFALRQFPPLSVRWKGFLQTPTSGPYRFILLTTDEARITLDGKPVCPGGNQDSAQVPLAKGLHSIEVEYRKIGGTEAALSLLWWKPGDSKYEVIPATAFRRDRGASVP